MRKIIISRHRALACFGVSYHCVLGMTPEEHLSWVRERNRDILMQFHSPASMGNGETICIGLDDNASTIFVIAYLEKKELMTEVLPIPAGYEDLHFIVETEFDGNRRLSLKLFQEERPGEKEAAGESRQP